MADNHERIFLRDMNEPFNFKDRVYTTVRVDPRDVEYVRVDLTPTTERNHCPTCSQRITPTRSFPDCDHQSIVSAIGGKPGGEVCDYERGGTSYQRRLYGECIIAGWDAGKQNTFAEEIAHLHEELSEAFRAYRKRKDFEVTTENGKLEGVPIEFADVLIGLFYNAELHGFDLFAAVEQKHRFNLTRNYQTEGRQLHDPAAATSLPEIEDTTNTNA